MTEQDNYQTIQETEVDKQKKLIENQRKFRNLESDRKAYAEETVANIKKKRTIIDKLKNENNALKDLIAKLNNQNVKNTQPTKPVNVENVIEEIKVVLENESKKKDDIEKNIDKFQKKIIEKRQTLGGINAGVENQSALTKQIKILENRLDKANQKFNEAIAINKNLRQQIDSLRRERVIFDNLYKKLEKELHEKRKEMANIIEHANTAYEERDKANDQIQHLKTQAKRESADFEKDLRELSQIQEKNKKNLDYIKLTEKNKDENAINQDLNETDKFKSKLPQKLFKDKNVSQVNIDKIMKYEEDFAKIQAATQIKDFEQLVSIFIKNEEKNFTMFKYVNELSNEIEELEKTINELKEEKEKYEGQGSNIDIQRKKLLKDLEEKLSKSENKAEQFEFKYHDSLKLINSLTNWIETLFNTIECDKTLAKELAGTHGVTDSNMMTFLGIIEDKVNQILQFYALVTEQRSNETFQNLMNNVSISQNITQKNKIDFPNFNEDVEDDEIEGNKALTLEEFRARALDKLEINSKKNQTGIKPKHKSQSKSKKK